MPAFDAAEVHLWRIALGAASDEVADLWPLLSNEESIEAQKLVSDEHRARVTTCRAAVRQILGMYLEQPPEEIRFVRTACGKPRLTDAGGGEPLRFNVSRSRDLAVLAVSSNRHVGVDIEAIRPVLELERIAERILGPAEKTAFLAAETSGRGELFLRYWTQKKAYLKALGLPPRIPLDRVEVDFRADTPVQLRAGLQAEAAVDRFTVCDFIPQTGFCGAFAVRGRQLPRVRYGKWFNQVSAASASPCSPR